METETLLVTRIERCNAKEGILEVGDYYYLVRKGRFSYKIKTYAVPGNDSNCPENTITIHAEWDPKKRYYKHNAIERLKFLYENNRHRTFENLGRGKLGWIMLKDVQCGFVYYHNGDLPGPEWPIGEKRELYVRPDGLKLMLSLPRERTQNAISQTEPEETPWLSPTQLFSAIGEEQNFDRLFSEVLENAKNESVMCPKRLIRNLDMYLSTWVFEYVDYVLDGYFRKSRKSDYRQMRELTSLVIKIEKHICYGDGVMAQLGVEDARECAAKAQRVIRRAQALGNAAALLENPDRADSLFNEMARSLYSYGEIIEDSEKNIDAYVESVCLDSRELLRNHALPVIELTNALSYRHKFTSNQLDMVLGSLVNGLLLRYEELSTETIIMLGSLILLITDPQTIESDKRKAVLYLTMQKICETCDRRQKAKAISSLVLALETGQVSDMIFCWENFNKMVAAAKEKRFSSMISNLAETLDEAPTCYESLTGKCVESIAGSETIRNLCRGVFLSAVELCVTFIDIPADNVGGLLEQAIDICEKCKDEVSLSRFKSLLQEHNGKLAAEKEETERKMLQGAIRQRQEEVTKAWDQLYEMAKSLDALESTLIAIQTNKESALLDAEEKARRDYATLSLR